MNEEIPYNILTQIQKVPCGQKKRIKHCKADSSMIISHTKQGYSCYCFRCGLRGFEAHGRQSIADIHKRAQEYRDSLKESADLWLPQDYTCDVPEEHAVWYLSKGISGDIAHEYGIGWSPSLERIIIPVYEDTYHMHVQGQHLVSVQMRAVRDDQKPKYWAPGSNKFPTSVFWVNQVEDDCRIIVEDCLSALKVGLVFPSAAIMGTDCNQGRCLKFVRKDQQIITWFDNDKAGRKAAEQAAQRCGMMGRAVIDIVTEKDPKMYTQSEIKEIVNAALKP